MKILFLEIDTETDWVFASLGPAFLAAYLRRNGHEAVGRRAIAEGIEAHAAAGQGQYRNSEFRSRRFETSCVVPRQVRDEEAQDQDLTWSSVLRPVCQGLASMVIARSAATKQSSAAEALDCFASGSQ